MSAMSGIGCPPRQQLLQPDSLYRSCQHCLLSSERHLSVILKNIKLPTTIHLGLFIEGVLEVQRVQSHYGLSIAALLSQWPEESLTMSKLFPDKKIGILLQASDNNGSVMDMIQIGLLNQKKSSKLTKLDLCCVAPSSIFHLPVLFLPETDKLWDELINMIMEKAKLFVGEGDDTMESVLSWKLTEISQIKIRYCFTYDRPDSVHICLENKISLTEWVAMIDEIIGLCTQNMSPFRYSFTNLSVDNFYIIDSKLLKWLLSVVDIEVLIRLFIYGKKRSIRLVMWELHEQLSGIPNLRTFGLGTTGPQINTQLISPSEPTDDDCVQPTRQVLEHWNHLENLQLIGLSLTDRLAVWLDGLASMLNTLSLYACKLSKQDLVSLHNSRHVSTLTQLSLEKNDLRDCGPELCQLVRCASQLELLNLRETKLNLDDKLDVITALHESSELKTLAMYEQEEMLPASGYQSMVELACGIPNLKDFYVFPFNYKPFELFCRESVEQAAKWILSMNERSDIQLYY